MKCTVSRFSIDPIRYTEDFLNLTCQPLHPFVYFQFQPTKQKVKKKADFSTDFQFVSSVKEYNQDTWDDLTKYINRKAKNKVDDKIDAARKERMRKKVCLSSFVCPGQLQFYPPFF